MKKKLIIAAITFAFILLLIPTRVHYEDGGSVGYKAPLYEVIKLHQLGGDDDVKPYIDGIEINILGMTVYRDINE